MVVAKEGLLLGRGVDNSHDGEIVVVVPAPGDLPVGSLLAVDAIPSLSGGWIAVVDNGAGSLRRAIVLVDVEVIGADVWIGTVTSEAPDRPTGCSLASHKRWSCQSSRCQSGKGKNRELHIEVLDDVDEDLRSEFGFVLIVGY